MNQSYREMSPYTHPVYYNVKAEPFFPSENKDGYFVKVAKLGASVSKDSLKELLDSVISTNFEENQHTAYSVQEFDSEESGSIEQEDDENIDTHSSRKFAILKIESWEVCNKLIGILNGYVLSDCILDVKIINGSTKEDFESYGKVPYQNEPQFRYSRSQSAPGYFKPYLPGTPIPYDYMYQHPSSPPVYPNYPESPRGYLSRRSSNKSSDSKRSSRNNSFSNSTKPVPPFLMNLVNQGYPQTMSSAEDSETDNTSITESIKPESIVIENEEGQPVKVNPCRIFVGNIPYSSTWMSLKNFLIDRSKEIDPNNNLSILRVEIPMQSQSSSLVSSSEANAKGTGNSYPYMSNVNNNESQRLKTNNASGPGEEGSKSRGFAIVTTRNKESSDKLIEYFDNVEFQGRSLTVRYDRFPDYNNYVLQQVHSANNKNKGINSKTSVLSLAFERNSFQHRFYYGNNSLSRSYMSYPFYYNVPPPIHSPYPPYFHSPQASAMQNPYMNNIYLPNEMEKGEYSFHGEAPRNRKPKKVPESIQTPKQFPDGPNSIPSPKSGVTEIAKSLESYSLT